MKRTNQFDTRLDPIVIARVQLCPRLSVTVPAHPGNTPMLTGVRGPGENVSVREVPMLDAK